MNDNNMAPPTNLEPQLQQDPAHPGPKPYALIDDYLKAWKKEYIGHKDLTDYLSDGIPLRIHQVWRVFGDRIDFGNRGMLTNDQDICALEGREGYNHRMWEK